MPAMVQTSPRVAVSGVAVDGAARAGLVAAAYFGLASASVYLTRFDGGLAFIWIANALLVAEMTYLPRAKWLPTLVGAVAANFAATSLFGLGLAVAPLMALCAVVEATLGAMLLRRWGVRSIRLDSLRSTAMFAAAVGGVAPLVTAFPLAAAATLVTGGAYWSHALAALLGHSLGTVIFAPMLLLLLDGSLLRTVRSTTAQGLLAAAVPIIVCAAVIAATFGQTRYPLLFLPTLPLVFMSFRFGQIGAALTILLIALLGGGLTVAGFGPIQLIALSTGQRTQFFQFYLAIVTLTALPVAAELSHRRRLFAELKNSEARFRMLTQRSSDVIMSVDRRGVIDYISPSITELGDYRADTLIGTFAGAMIHPDDQAAVLIEHRRALAEPEVTGSFEYRGRLADGSYRWFESSVRGIVGEHGVATGVISAIRDITRRKDAERALSVAAVTDPLTGLPNRRDFVRRLDQRVAAAACGSRDGYCAIVDFDHFKHINDSLGHDAGDRALVAFAKRTTELLAPGEMIARIGGEEFAILLNRANIGAARRACEAVCRAVAALRLTTASGAPIPVTVSIGLAPIDRDSAAGTVLADADGALYRAKAGGRDRVMVSGQFDCRTGRVAVPLALAS